MPLSKFLWKGMRTMMLMMMTAIKEKVEKWGRRKERKEEKKSFPGVCVNLQSLQVPAVTLVPLGHFPCDPTK